MPRKISAGVIVVLILMGIVALGGIAWIIFRYCRPSKSMQKTEADVVAAQKAAEEGGELSWEEKKAIEKWKRAKGRQNVMSYWCF